MDFQNHKQSWTRERSSENPWKGFLSGTFSKIIGISVEIEVEIKLLDIEAVEELGEVSLQVLKESQKLFSMKWTNFIKDFENETQDEVNDSFTFVF